MSPETTFSLWTLEADLRVRRWWRMVRSFIASSLIFALALVAIACHTPAILTPKTGPGTDEACSHTEHPCVDVDLRPTGTCCPEDSTCGGAGWRSLGCPPGACCDIAPSQSDLVGGAQGRPATPTRPQRFGSKVSRELACLDLQDHIAALYADDRLAEQDAQPNAVEREAFRKLYAEKLAKAGAFDRFQASCFPSLTPPAFVCGMAARTPDALERCERGP